MEALRSERKLLEGLRELLEQMVNLLQRAKKVLDREKTLLKRCEESLGAATRLHDGGGTLVQDAEIKVKEAIAKVGKAQSNVEELERCILDGLGLIQESERSVQGAETVVWDASSMICKALMRALSRTLKGPLMVLCFLSGLCGLCAWWWLYGPKMVIPGSHRMRLS